MALAIDTREYDAEAIVAAIGPDNFTAILAQFKQDVATVSATDILRNKTSIISRNDDPAAARKRFEEKAEAYLKLKLWEQMGGGRTPAGIALCAAAYHSLSGVLGTPVSDGNHAVTQGWNWTKRWMEATLDIPALNARAMAV